MSRSNLTLSAVLLVATMLSSLPMFASGVPIRRPSDNGADGNANTWNLVARTVPRLLTAGTKKVTFSRQIVCPKFDVEDSLPSPVVSATGTCDSGDYLHIFQFTSPSTTTPVKITISQLVNFASAGNFGAMVCEVNPPVNTNTLCTTDPTTANIPNFTITNSRTSITFVLPNIPAYPAGSTNQGQGLTLYVITHQAAQSLPIQLPTVTIQ